MVIKELYDGFPRLLSFRDIGIYERLREGAMLDTLPNVQFSVHSQVDQYGMSEDRSRQVKVTCTADQQRWRKLALHFGRLIRIAAAIIHIHPRNVSIWS